MYLVPNKTCKRKALLRLISACPIVEKVKRKYKLYQLPNGNFIKIERCKKVTLLLK
jgi:hypothetical protein